MTKLPSIWASPDRRLHAYRAIELKRAHPDWSFGAIGAQMAKEGMKTTSGTRYETTAVILLLMLGEYGFPDWL